MKNLFLTAIILSVALTGCSFWKSTSLNPKRVIYIRNGAKPGQVTLKRDEYGLEDLSVGISVSRGKICVADNESRRVQIIKQNGDVELIIGPAKKAKADDIPAEKFNFGGIGFIALDDDDNIYVQNKFSQIRDSNGDKNSGHDSIDFSPSYIVVFSKDGELQYTLGQKGAPDTPFSHVERLYAYAKDRVYVISRSTDSWSVFRFKGKKRDYFFNLNSLDFKDRDEGNVYEGKIDNVRIYAGGEKMLISVSYYHGLRLKYIKIFEFSIAGNKIEKTIMEIPDPKNVLFDILDDKYVYLWNVSNGDVKFEVANLDGTIINNVYLEFKNSRSYYSKIVLDDNGKIYSYHVLRNGVDVLKWE